MQALIITVDTIRGRIIITHDVIISLQAVRGRIIVTHDVIISLLAVRGRIIITHDVMISLQQKLRENYSDGESVRQKMKERVRESE